MNKIQGAAMRLSTRYGREAGYLELLTWECWLFLETDIVVVVLRLVDCFPTELCCGLCVDVTAQEHLMKL